jgi:hypothetical protein
MVLENVEQVVGMYEYLFYNGPTEKAMTSVIHMAGIFIITL